jgi:hypothetical protein
MEIKSAVLTGIALAIDGSGVGPVFRFHQYMPAPKIYIAVAIASVCTAGNKDSIAFSAGINASLYSQIICGNIDCSGFR